MAFILPKSGCSSENTKIEDLIEDSLKKEKMTNTSSVCLSANITLAGPYLLTLSEAIIPIQHWTAKGTSVTS